jgi:hypothetical protein
VGDDERTAAAICNCFMHMGETGWSLRAEPFKGDLINTSGAGVGVLA